MPRERQIFVGLAAVAAAGLMFDKMFLAPAGAEAAPAELAVAGPGGAGGPVRAAADAVGARIESGIRDALTRALADHASETVPAMGFGPELAWIQRETPQSPGQVQPAAVAPEAGFLPGLPKVPQLSLVMPTSGGGVAVIDGRRLQVGQTHPDGYVLTGVQERSATITMGGATAVISLPSPGN